MQIAGKYIDSAGRYRVTVNVDGIRCLMLKFIEDPTDLQAFEQAQSVLDAEAAEAARLTELQALETERLQILADLQNGNY